MRTIIEAGETPHTDVYKFQIHIATPYKQSPEKHSWILGTKSNEVICQ